MNSAEVSLPTAYATNGSNILAPTSFRQKGRTKSTKHSLIKQHVFHNNPLPGWRKEVNVNLNYKMRTQKGRSQVITMKLLAIYSAVRSSVMKKRKNS